MGQRIYSVSTYFLMFLVPITVLSQRADQESWLPDSVINLSFKGSTIYIPVDEGMKWYEDLEASLPFEAVLKQGFQRETEGFRDSLTPGSALWGSVRLLHPGPDTATFFIGTGRGDSVTCYIQHKGTWEKKVGGMFVRRDLREVKFGMQAWFQVEIPPRDTLSILFRSRELKERKPRLSPIVFTELSFQFHKYRTYANNTGFVAIFQGILIMILLYNLMVFAMTRDATYFWYAMYLLSLVMALFFDTTVRNYPILGFDLPRLNDFFSGFWLSSTSLWYFLFGRSFLNAQELTPRWDQGIKGIVIIRILFLSVVTMFLLFSWDFHWAFSGSSLLLGIEICFLFVYFVVLARKKSPVAWFFIIGSGIVFFFGFLQLLVKDLLPGNFFIVFLVSVLLEILIFSLGLGYKFRKSQKDKLAAERSLNEELTKINTAFGRFVPHEFLHNLGRKQATDVLLGDQVERQVTVFFSDIRSYTTLSEQMTPKENFDFLNGYLGRIGPIIQEEGGFVNQYYGDGIMALFLGLPDDGLRAAVRIQQKIHLYNKERITKNRMPIRLGIGLHTGPLMMGIIGDTLRMEAGVVSDTVNTASRMEGLTKHFGVRILISETTRSELSEDFALRSLGNVQVKGRVTPMSVWECFGGDSESELRCKQQSLGMHEQALDSFLNQQFAHAIRTWEQALGQCPDDYVMKRFHEQAIICLKEGVPDDWNGVEVMERK